MNRKLVAMGIGALVLSGGPSLRAQAGGREARFLDLLQEQKLDGFLLRRRPAGFRPAVNDYGQTYVAPHHSIGCMSSLARGQAVPGVVEKLAFALFDLYGLKPERNYRVEQGGVNALLTCFDPEVKVGFWLCPQPRAECELDKTGLGKLEASGHRVFVLDTYDFQVSNTESCAPVLGCVASLTRFLDAVTDGPDLAFDQALGRGLQRFALPELPRLPGVRINRRNNQEVLEVQNKTVLDLRIDAHLAVQQYDERKAAWRPTKAPVPTRGLLALVSLTLYGMKPPRVLPFRVTQERAPEEAIRVEARRNWTFMPSTFDAARPFVITFELEPGQYVLEEHVLVTGPERP